ncbi:hypothetical protein ACQXW1_17310, partial [Lactiplantibacillus pentosus]
TEGAADGAGFHLVFSPERVVTGRVFADLRRYPKLVGGLTPEGTARAVAIVQADHPEYAQLSADALPGLRLLLDGRRVTDPARFIG